MDAPCPQCDYVAPDDPTRFRKGPESRLAAHVRRIHGNGSTPSPEPDAEGPGPFEETDALLGGTTPDEESSPASTGEVAPRSAPAAEPARRRGPVAWMRDRARSRKDSPRETAEAAPRRGRPAGKRRTTAADLFTDIVGMGGGQLVRLGHVPTGRMVTFQAPVTGELLDDLVAGTALDRVLVQRLVGAKGTLDLLVAVAGPPALTWQLEKALALPELTVEQVQRKEARIGQLEAALKGVIRESLPTILPAAKRVRTREAKAQADLVDLLDPADLESLGISIVDGKAVDMDGRPVDVASVFVSMLFAEWEPTPQPTTQEATTT